MNFAKTQREFYEKLAACSDIASLKLALQATLSSLGYTFFAYNIYKLGDSFHPNGSAITPEQMVITNYPIRWIERYFHEKYDDIDPALHAVSSTFIASSWSDLLESSTIGARQRRMLDEAWCMGLANGYTLPIVTEFGECAAISVVPEANSSADRTERGLPIVSALAQRFHSKAKKIILAGSLKSGTSRRKSLLSGREIDVLFWTAKGKTAWETAAILGISQKSVELYTENAKTKLHAVNRTHAVMKAVMLGVVALS
ncbi:LuxR family transcriptional regulator [Bradyrhizobium sp. USDA 4369]